MNKLSKVFILLCAFPLVANADNELREKRYRTIEDECRKQFGDTLNNSIVMGCAEAASNAVKKDMNILYQKIYKHIEKRNQYLLQDFEDSQKSWLGYREKTCDLQGALIGTPMYSVCLLDFNKQRVNELEQFFEDIN